MTKLRIKDTVGVHVLFNKQVLYKLIDKSKSLKLTQSMYINRACAQKLNVPEGTMSAKTRAMRPRQSSQVSEKNVP